jgi:hypothetical protein
MTFGSERRITYRAPDHRHLPAFGLPPTFVRGAAAALLAGLGAWAVVGGHQDSKQTDALISKGDLVVARGDKLDVRVTRGDKLQVARPSHAAANLFASLFDSRFSLGGSSTGFVNEPVDDSETAPPLVPALPEANRNTRAVASMPSRGEQAAKRSAPTRLAAAAQRAARDDAKAGSPAVADTRTFWEKLFGKPAPITLAYAATDDAGLGVGRSIVSGRYDRWTAVYDISAHTVYMPDGSQLEAHSGLGSWLDDPQHADQRMRGVTPPNLYNLELREQPFHGVRALRMIPQDERKTFGRRGILAHTYMLGPNGDSNGCVSFKNYDAFLQAFLRQDVKRLAVVTRLADISADAGAK